MEGSERIAWVETEERCLLMSRVPRDLALEAGDWCLVIVERVEEIGRVVALRNAEAGCEPSKLPGVVLRRATFHDEMRTKENETVSAMAAEKCKVAVQKHGLDMTLVKVRYSFDRALLRVWFASDGRVDFRELVKELTNEWNVRIEMRQIGVRDKARLVGGMGPCGRQFCCCTWLTRFESVNVKMAREQQLSMNPGAITGMCGRLKCCLRYEREGAAGATEADTFDGEPALQADGQTE